MCFSAAVYISRGTPDASTWTAPIPVFNNPNANIFQYMPWVQITRDHTVHVTYSGGTTSNTALAHFYVQSTDQGATWSAPFQLSDVFAPTGFMGDYEGTDLGGFVTGSSGSGIQQGIGHPRSLASGLRFAGHEVHLREPPAGDQGCA